MDKLDPCPVCGEACRIETFEGRHIKGQACIWVCSNNRMFGGTCPDPDGYLSAEAWNTRPEAADEITRLNAEVERWRELACRAIDAVHDAERETDWGCPTFGPSVSESLRAEYDALILKARGKDANVG